MSGGRLWGWWTEWKLDLLRYYLPAFANASKSVGTTTYLDLFAGVPGNRSRETGEPLQSGAEIALSVTPLFTHLRLFELERAADFEGFLLGRFPGRDLKVIEGDCNDTIGRVLVGESLPTWAPTFAFIDPDGPDCWWTTLEALAGFKRGSKYKVELWMLFPVGMMTRMLEVSGSIPEDYRDRITRVFGSEDWQGIYRARVEGELAPADAQFEYVNLMRWRIEKILGYAWTHAFDVKNSKNVHLYSMVFATDNRAGHKIMGETYEKFAARFPEMAEEARRRKQSQGTLFPTPIDRAPYEHTEALPPYGSPSRRA